MLRAAIPLLLGLVIARSLDVPLVVCYPTTIILVVVWAVSAFRPTSYALRWRTGMLLPLGWIALGVTVARLHDPRFRPDDVGRLADTAQGWRVTVQELVSDNGRTVRAWAEADAAVADTIQGASGVLLLTLLKDSLHPPPAVGARLLVAARAEALDRVPDPGGFDQRQWAATHGARYGCFAPQGRWAIIGERSHGPQLFQGMRDRITVWLEASGLPGPERALVKAVLLGVRDEMDQGQKQDFIRSGTVHVLAVSGSHVAIIYISIAGGLSFLGKKRQGRWVRGAITLLMLWLYAGITGFSPSVLRATLTFSLFVLADMGGWRTGALNSLASAAVLLLLWDPGMMVQPGFQLSFLAVLGIVMFYRPLMDRWAAPDPVLHYFWSLCAVSLAAQAFTLPLSLYLFHAFPIWFLPANLVVVGLVGHLRPWRHPVAGLPPGAGAGGLRGAADGMAPVGAGAKRGLLRRSAGCLSSGAHRWIAVFVPLRLVAAGRRLDVRHLARGALGCAGPGARVHRNGRAEYRPAQRTGLLHGLR